MSQEAWRIQVYGRPDIDEKFQLVQALELHLSPDGETCVIENIEILSCSDGEAHSLDAVVEVVKHERFKGRLTDLHVSILPEDSIAIQVAFDENGALHLRNLNTYESDIFPSDSAHDAFVQHLRARIRSARTNRAIRSAHSMISRIEDQVRARS